MVLGLSVTLKVRASLLSGCLQMMMTQTAQSRVKMTTGTTTPACPSRSSWRQLARMTQSTVIRTAAGRQEGQNVTQDCGGKIYFTTYICFILLFLQIIAVVA